MDEFDSKAMLWIDDDYCEEDSDEGSEYLHGPYVEIESEVALIPMNELESINEKLLIEIVKLMQKHSEVSCGNALELNKLMQTNLSVLQEKLESLLQSIKKRYVQNEAKLIEVVSNNNRNRIAIRGAFSRGRTFYFKGSMFFKDANWINCPNTPDYTQRSQESEMFPMNFGLMSNDVWCLWDKIGVFQGIKKQVIEYLEARNKKSKPKTQAQIQESLNKKKLGKLLEIADSGFQIDWSTIAAYHLKHRHTDFSCNAMWNVYLKPSISRASWTNTENNQLYEVAKKHNFEDWQAIANEMNERSDYQCFKHFYTRVYFMVENNCIKWTKEEDKRLLQLVNAYTFSGAIQWNSVSSRFPSRNKTQCVYRYYCALDPTIIHESFTPAEDITLLAAFEEYGENFSRIPRNLFPNRSVVQLRNRYKTTFCHRNKLHPWTVEENQKLMDFVAEHGVSSWKKCAETFGCHSHRSCRTRYLTLTKFLDQNPNGTVNERPALKRRAENSITTDIWVEKISEMQNNPDACFKRKKETSTEKKPAVSRENNDNRLTYVSKLRYIDLEAYNFFKYSYNCRLGIDCCSIPLTKFQSLALVKLTLGFNISVGRALIHDKMLPENIALTSDRMLTELPIIRGKNNQLGSRMPPNWSTLMGFRALCVQFADKFPATRLISSNPIKKHNNDAVKIFRQRLRSIFHTTGLISRLKPQNIDNLGERVKSQISAMYNLLSSCQPATLEISTPSTVPHLETPYESLGMLSTEVKSVSIKSPVNHKIMKEKARISNKEELVQCGAVKNQCESIGTHKTEVKNKPIKLSIKHKIKERITSKLLAKNVPI